MVGVEGAISWFNLQVNPDDLHICFHVCHAVTWVTSTKGISYKMRRQAEEKRWRTAVSEVK